MVTKHSLAVCDLWNSMTSLERASFVQCVVGPDISRLVTANVDRKYRVTSYIIDDVSATSVESAKQFIAGSYNGAYENMLIKLVNNNKPKLAMKLLTKMAAIDDWRSIVQRSLNEECVGGGTLLHEAAKYSCIVDLREFITTDLLSNLQPNDNGDTPLHLAAAYGHAKDVEVLLEKSMAFTFNKKGWSPLHYAVSSKSPSVNIVSSLIHHVLVHDPSALDAQSSEYDNTALHLACRNTNADEKLLTYFMEADPTICNSDRQTPLHLAAEREHDPQPIAVLLDMFLPRMSESDLGVNVDFNCIVIQSHSETSTELEPYCQSTTIYGYMCNSNKVSNNTHQPQQTFHFNGKSHIDTLLTTCAKNGHRDAVALLLQNGADPKYVLHDIVDESVKRHDKINEMLAVYETVVGNIILPYSRWLTEEQDDNWGQASKGPPQASKDHIQARRQRIIELVEEPSRFGKNVIERAIELGAKDLLLAILNTRNVFRFDDVGEIRKDLSTIDCERINYDVTNMIRSTMSGKQDTKSGLGSRVSDVSIITQKNRPKKSYIEQITENESVWRKHDIFRIDPFKRLSKSYVSFMKRLDFIIGCGHLIYMTLLSFLVLPTKCSLNEQFSLNLSDCNTTDEGDAARDLHPSWLAWPVILLVYQLFFFFSHIRCMCRTVYRLNIYSQQYGEVRSVSGEAEALGVKILYKLVDKAPFCAFFALMTYWCTISPSPCASSYNCYNTYIEVASMAFLFGWIITFMLFCRVTKNIYVLSLVLKSVMIRDLLFTFILFFLTLVIAFTCTVYVLQMTLIDRPIDLQDTFYEIFSTAFSVGDLYEYTVDPKYLEAGGRGWFLKIVYLAYLTVMVLILFNYLIAMMSHRYEKEIPHAENAWRFDCVTDMMHLEYRFTSCLLGWIHRLHYWCLVICCPKRNQIETRFDDRYFITVQRWRPWLKDPDDEQ